MKSSSSGTASSGSSTPAETSAPVEKPAVSEPAESSGSAETPEEIMAYVDAGIIHADNYYCGLCGFETTSYDEYVAHMTGVHGMQ